MSRRFSRTRHNARHSARPKPKFHVIFEDSDLIVVSKDAGILSVPFAGAQSPNALELVNLYLAKKRQHGLVVHRIDRYTSGVIVFAKHPKARERLMQQFKDHSTTREYLAIIRGTPKHRRGELRHYMKLSKNGFRQMIVPKRERGATLAELSYELVDASGGLSLLRIRLKTGLKNQIRVQLSAAGFPIVGDRHYVAKEAEAPEGLDRQALHAALLGLKHPASGKYVEFTTPLPADMRRVLETAGFDLHQS